MRNRRRGASVIEFTLIGIPIMFVLISIFELSRAMWLYNTAAHAVREGTRFAAAHANNCALLPNGCASTLAQISQRILEQGVGLNPAEVRNVRFLSKGANPTASPLRTYTCATLAACLSDSRSWPALTAVATQVTELDPLGQRGSYIEIRAQYPFRTAIALLFPGSPTQQIGVFNLEVSSEEIIHY